MKRSALWISGSCLIVIGVAAGAALRHGGGPSSTPAETTSPSLLPPEAARVVLSAGDVGRTQVYALSFEQVTKLVAADETGSARASVGANREGTITVRVEGSLSLGYVEPEDEAKKYRLSLSKLELSLSGGKGSAPEHERALREELEKPAYVLLSPEGHVQALYVSKSTSTLARGLVRTFASELQVTLAQKGTLVRLERDTTGEYQARISCEGDTCTKTRGSYTRVATPKGLLATEAAPSLSGKTMFTMGTDGLVRNSTTDAVTQSRVGKGMPTVSSRLHAALVHERVEMNPSLLGVFSREAPMLEKTELADSEALRLAERRSDEALAGTTPADTLFASVMSAAGDHERAILSDKVVARLRVNEDEARALADVARSRGGSEADQAIALLGAAGTSKAQAELSKMLRDPKVASDAKVSAAQSLALTEHPTEEAARGLADARKDRDAEVRMASTLALGGTVRNLGAGDPELARELVRELVLSAKGASGSDEKVAILRALGNAGDPSGLPLVEEALQSDDDLVVQAAVHALRFMPKVDGLLRHLLSTHEEGAVRETVVATMNYRPFELHVDALLAAAANDAMDGVRVDAIELLAAKGVGNQKVKDGLSRLSSLELSEEVRGALSRALGALSAP